MPEGLGWGACAHVSILHFFSCLGLLCISCRILNYRGERKTKVSSGRGRASESAVKFTQRRLQGQPKSGNMVIAEKINIVKCGVKSLALG